MQCAQASDACSWIRFKRGVVNDCKQYRPASAAEQSLTTLCASCGQGVGAHMAFAAAKEHAQDAATALFLALRNARCVVATVASLVAGVSAPKARSSADLCAAAVALASAIVPRLLHCQRSKLPVSSEMDTSCRVRCVCHRDQPLCRWRSVQCGSCAFHNRCSAYLPRISRAGKRREELRCHACPGLARAVESACCRAGGARTRQSNGLRHATQQHPAK